MFRLKVATILGLPAAPAAAETTVGKTRQKVQEWKPGYGLVCKDADA